MRHYFCSIIHSGFSGILFYKLEMGRDKKSDKWRVSNNLRFNDDCVLMNESTNQLQLMILRLHRKSQKKNKYEYEEN